MEYPGTFGGFMVANPITTEYAMDEELILATIEKTLKESVEQGIKGKETTPFLLGKVVELTGGDSLEANINLVFTNAKLASEITMNYRNNK